MLAVGATGPERSQIIAMLKAGASYEEVVERFRHVEGEYFRRNRDELLAEAGFEAEKPEAAEEAPEPKKPKASKKG